MSFPSREQGISVPAESKSAPAESKGYTLRCSGDLLCGYLRGCRGEEEKPELERVVVNSYGLVDRLPVSACNFRRALQRHFLVDFQTEDIAEKIFSRSKGACLAFVNRTRNSWTAFARYLPKHWFHDLSKTDADVSEPLQRHLSLDFQTQNIIGKIFSCSKRACFALWIERETAEQRPLEVCRRIELAMVRRLRTLQSEALQRHLWIDFKTKISLERSFPALINDHVLLLWIEPETAEHRSIEVWRRIDFAIDWRPRPLWSSTFLQAIQSTTDMRCIRDIDLEKVWNEVQKLKPFFLFVLSTWLRQEPTIKPDCLKERWTWSPQTTSPFKSNAKRSAHGPHKLVQKHFDSWGYVNRSGRCEIVHYCNWSVANTKVPSVVGWQMPSLSMYCIIPIPIQALRPSIGLTVSLSFSLQASWYDLPPWQARIMTSPQTFIVAPPYATRTDYGS